MRKQWFRRRWWWALKEEDGKITDDDAGESELDDDRELSGIDNSDEGRQVVLGATWLGYTDISFLFLINWLVR